MGDKRDLCFLLFCTVIACLFILSPRLMSLAYGLIDPSFNYAIDAAGIQKLAFGTSFIATYGPLGYLVSNYLPARVTLVEIWMILYALVTGIGVFIFVKQYTPRTWARWMISLALLYGLTISAGGGFIEWNYLATFLLYCFIYLKIAPSVRPYLAVALTGVSVVFLFTKFTLGAGSLASVLLLVSFASRVNIRRRMRLLAGVLMVYMAASFIIGRYLGVINLYAYIKTGIIVGDQFSAAMSLYSSQTVAATVLVFITLAAFVIWVMWREKFSAYRYLFMAPPLLLAWKYCVARQDGHIMALLSAIVPLGMLYYIAIGRQLGRYRQSDTLILVAIVCIACVSLWANNMPYYGPGGFAYTITNPAAKIVDGDIVKFFDVPQQKKQWAQQSAVQEKGGVLPASMRSIIGSGTVDVFPWETTIIAANNLHWQPRPSPFSFETYSPYLDDLNARFIRSDKAPEFIVWHSTGNNGTYGIDGRNVLWDEPDTLKAILENYDLKSSSQSFMLLQRRHTPMSLDASAVDIPYELGGKQWVNIPQTSKEMQFLRFTTIETLTNEAKTTLIRGNMYYLQLKTAKNETYMYRFVKANSSQGFLINDLPLSWGQLVYFMQHHTLNTNDRITAIKLVVQ